MKKLLLILVLLVSSNAIGQRNFATRVVPHGGATYYTVVADSDFNGDNIICYDGVDSDADWPVHRLYVDGSNNVRFNPNGLDFDGPNNYVVLDDYKSLIEEELRNYGFKDPNGNRHSDPCSVVPQFETLEAAGWTVANHRYHYQTTRVAPRVNDTIPEVTRVYSVDWDRGRGVQRGSYRGYIGTNLGYGNIGINTIYVDSPEDASSISRRRAQETVIEQVNAYHAAFEANRIYK